MKPEPGSDASTAAPLPFRLRLWLAIQATNPGSLLLFAPVVALLLGVLSAAPPWRRTSLPLLDLMLRRLPAAPRATEVVLVDLTPWPSKEDGPDARARARTTIAELLSLLSRRPDLTIGFDVILEDETRPGADRTLATAMRACPRLVSATEIDPRDCRERPLAVPFRGLFRTGVVNVTREEGVVRLYGVEGCPGTSFAGSLAALGGAVRNPVRRPFLVTSEVEGGPIAVYTATELLASSAALQDPAVLQDTFPRNAVVIVGVIGQLGPDTHVLVGRDGYAAIGGPRIHAVALQRILSGRQPRLGGTLANLGAVGFSLAAFLGAVRLVGRGQTALLLTASTIGLLGLPGSFLLVWYTGIGVLPFGPMVAPLTLLTMAAAGPWLVRAVRYRLWFRRLLANAPVPVSASFEAAVREEKPLSRLARIFDAYEALLHYQTVCVLTTQGVPRKGAAASVRDAWYRTMTLPTLLATFRSVAPGTCEELVALSRLDGQPLAATRLEGMARAFRDNATAGTAEVNREKVRNWFVRLRNLVAHDTAAWMDEAACAEICELLHRQLGSILRIPAVAANLRDLRLEVRAPGEGDGPSVHGGRIPTLVSVSDASKSWPAYPWLLCVDASEAKLFRFRGLSEAADWPTREGAALKMVTYSEFGPAARGLPERRTLPLSDIQAWIPASLQITVTK